MTAVNEAGLVPDILMLSAAVEACSNAGDGEGAVHFYDQAIRLGFAPDEGMYQEVRKKQKRIAHCGFVGQPYIVMVCEATVCNGENFVRWT